MQLLHDQMDMILICQHHLQFEQSHAEIAIKHLAKLVMTATTLTEMDAVATAQQLIQFALTEFLTHRLKQFVLIYELRLMFEEMA